MDIKIGKNSFPATKFFTANFYLFIPLFFNIFTLMCIASKAEERKRCGMISGTVGIFLNFLLFVIKFCSGIFTNSVSVMADAFNNCSDVASSVVTFFGFKVSAEKADDEHPFGHGRMEYIAGLIVSVLIIFVGAELLKSSIEILIKPEPIEKSVLVTVILFASILVKLFMFALNLKFSKKINSAALKAAAKDSLSDVFSTLIVVVAILIESFFPELNCSVDGIAGIIVSFFIIANGFDSAKETINPLLGIPADKNLAQKIETCVLEFKPILGVHDLLIHEYGPGHEIISLHAEVPGNLNLFEIHQIIDDAEKAVSERFHCSVTIHIDPVDLSDKETLRFKEFLKNAACEIDKNLSVHDVRLIQCENQKKVCFEILRPSGLKLSNEELLQKFTEKAKQFNPEYECEIQIDNSFVSN